MIQSFSFTNRQDNDSVIISLIGYLEKDGGQELRSFVDSQVKEGIRKFILDFQKIELISSPGLAALLQIGGQVVEDHDGKIVSFGLDKHHHAVLDLANFFWLASDAPDEKTALVLVDQDD